LCNLLRDGQPSDATQCLSRRLRHKAHLNQQLAQLKLVAIFEGYGYIRGQSFAIQEGAVGARQVLYLDGFTPLKNAGVLARDAVLSTMAGGEVYLGKNVLYGIIAAQTDGLYQ